MKLSKTYTTYHTTRLSLSLSLFASVDVSRYCNFLFLCLAGSSILCMLLLLYHTQTHTRRVDFAPRSLSSFSASSSVYVKLIYYGFLLWWLTGGGGAVTGVTIIMCVVSLPAVLVCVCVCRSSELKHSR